MDRRRNWIVSLALFSVTMVLYWPATTFSFVNIDDQFYVYDNPEVLKGFSWGGIRWAFTTVEAGNWAPVTLISHMADCSLYRQVAGGHHLTNILLHSVNAVLLWLLLKRMTGSFWPSALVAALFAWHPLNVESVAWVSERKNVLSTFFFILTIWAYWSYVQKRHRVGYYVLALLVFALGLAAKSMLVTLPCLLLLLDYWPLRRMSFQQNFSEQLRQKETWALVLEKIPFLMLAVADGWGTYAAQNHSGAVRSFSMVPLENRLLNIPVAYVTYLVKTFWPDGLCVFYPFPPTPHIAAAATASILLAAMMFMAWHWRVKLPWLLVGWFWFLGTLVPVIGLVQVGGQAWADRYAYVPLIGIFLLVAFGLQTLLVARPQPWAGVVTVVSVFLGLCLILTGRQLRNWQDSVTLFTQAVAVSPENALAQNMLGRALAGADRPKDAVERFEAAVRLRPDSTVFQYDLGRRLIDVHRFAAAQEHLAVAVQQQPDNPIFHNTRGVALMMNSNSVEAQKEFDRAVELQPDFSNARFNLGKVLLTEGQTPAAISNFATALKLQPDWPEALQNLARAYMASGNVSNAVAAASRALKIVQTNPPSPLAAEIAAELKTYQNALTPQSSALPKN